MHEALDEARDTMGHAGRAGRVVSINISRGGVPKQPVPLVDVTALGIVGDGHRDRRHHGGPDRALTVFSLEVIRQLQAEGHPIAAGTTGENITVEGLDWERVVPGAVLEIGEVRAQVTSYASPCQTIRHSFSDSDSTRIAQAEYPGWSRVCCRILAEGRIALGDQVRVSGATSTSRPHR